MTKNTHTPIEQAIKALEKLKFNDFTGHDAFQEYCEQCTNNMYPIDAVIKALKAYANALPDLPTLAELTKLAKAIQWGPIEEAPKDGTEIEIKFILNWKNTSYLDPDEHRIGRGVTVRRVWYSSGQWIERNDNRINFKVPTHYRPIINPDDYPLAMAYIEQLKGKD